MEKTSFRVDKSKALTAVEEYDIMRTRIDAIGNFFPWDVHPNQVTTANRQIERLLKKLYDIVDTEEYQHYTANK